MRDRWGLLQRGLFPETLPPCFTSVDLKRAFSGLVRPLKSKELHAGRQSDYIRYNGTKHDGTRRYFGTPNPISYFYVCDFIARHWTEFDVRFASSPFSVSKPRLGRPSDDRPVIIPSLSELTTVASRKLGRSAFILKTDITQFFPSLYTHAIPWSAHGIDKAKADPKPDSVEIYFNRLDFFVRNCQRAETRGVLVGPDAFRLISEFVIAGLDAEVFDRIKDFTVGGARHVDDYYIGVSGQPEALAALSALREALQRFNFHINDSKTRTMVGVEPLNEVWAQKLRKQSRDVTRPYGVKDEDIILFLDDALTVARELGTDSPVKIALRTFDEIGIYYSDYRKDHWPMLEHYLQRILYHHPHCIDYIALLVAKRVAGGEGIDREGWAGACYDLITRHSPLGHHHEVVWLLWMMLVSGIALADDVVASLADHPNAHIRALVVAAHVEGLITKRPRVKFTPKLPTTDENWLVNLVARSSGFTGAGFSGALSAEFLHLATKKVKLIDFKAHMTAMKARRVKAISRTRYGYDSDHLNLDLDLDDDLGF
jgi:hypothetical protein